MFLKSYQKFREQKRYKLFIYFFAIKTSCKWNLVLSCRAVWWGRRWCLSINLHESLSQASKMCKECRTEPLRYLGDGEENKIKSDWGASVKTIYFVRTWISSLKIHKDFIVLMHMWPVLQFNSQNSQKEKEERWEEISCCFFNRFPFQRK